MDKTLETIAEAVLKQGEILETLIKSREDGELHTKTPASAHSGIKLHGDGGVFATPGLERDVISAHVRPYGIGNLLDLFPSTSEDPRYGSITGVTDDVGDEPTNPCDDAPTGYIKGCNLTSRFGMIRRDTNTIDIGKTMLTVNRGDFTDLILRGRMLGLTNLEPSGMNQGQILDLITMAEMVSAAVRTERVLSRQIWQGSYAIDNEFPGLDSQIATGQKDADTGTLCPALDSDVKNFNYQAVDATGTPIVEYLSMLEFYLRHNAMTMGLEPVQWVIAMRPELWFELSAVWPIAYNTTKANVTPTKATVFVDGRENVAERDAMRNGMYIDINGNRYKVVTDTGIFEHTNINNGNLLPGQYASSIYMVPLTIVGGLPVTYRQYVDFKMGQPDAALLKGMESFFWTDNGVYSWAIESVKWCYKLALRTEQRIVLRTPQLAGRIDLVKYSPLQHLRSPYADDPYFADGGVSVRGGLISSPQSVWA